MKLSMGWRWVVGALLSSCVCCANPAPITTSDAMNTEPDIVASPWEGLHPPKVEEAFAIFSRVDPEASPESIRALFGVGGDPIGGDVSPTEFVEVFELSPGYRIALTFDVNPYLRRTRLVEASLSAQGKPGFEPGEWHTLYPYWSKGAVVRE